MKGRDALAVVLLAALRTASRHAGTRAVPGFVYVKGIGRFRDMATGRFVAESRVYGAIAEDYRGVLADRLTGLTERLVDGSLPLDAWRDAFARELKDAHGIAAMAGKGGVNNMSPTDWGSVGGSLRREYAHLDGFAAGVADGTVSDAQALARARQYSTNVRQTYHDALIRSQAEAGLFMAFRLGNTEEHCGDCLRLDGQVHLASDWDSHPMRPQSNALECGGYNCDCRLVPARGPESGSF